MRIAIFGGSFDPVHIEHIRVVENAITSLGLDKVVVMPAGIPPHKKESTLSAGLHRLAMCRLAFAHLSQVEISDYEVQKSGTSYTYETCEYFRALYPEAELYWIVGTDMLRDFSTWRYPEHILQAVTLAVCARDEQSSWLQNAMAEFTHRFGVEFALVRYNGAPVSSTNVRVWAGAGLPIAEYVTDAVAGYIERNGLYEIPCAKEALALQAPKRRAHSVRVAELMASLARPLKIAERTAITAGLMHDCAKNLDEAHPLLAGFARQAEWGDIPPPVLHQFTGAYVAQTRLGVTDGDLLNAIRYHTSGRAGMSVLEKLTFVADVVEYGRTFAGVEELRAMLLDKSVPAEVALNNALSACLARSVGFVKEKGEYLYPLTVEGYAYYQK